MFYIVWLVTAFVAVGAGCFMARIIDKRNPEETE